MNINSPSQINHSFWKICGVKSIDHFAVTCSDLNQVLNDYLGIEGCELLRGPGTNTSQNVDYAFVKTLQGMVIEILAVKKNSPITSHVQNGGGAYHLCFTVNNLDFAEKKAIENGAIQVIECREDDVFDGRRVSFFVHPEHGLFEFLEAYPKVFNQKSEQHSVKLESDAEKNKNITEVERIVFESFSITFPKLHSREEIETAQLGITASWDSLKQLQLLMEVEKRSKIKFSVNELSAMICYKDFVDLLNKKLNYDSI